MTNSTVMKESLVQGARAVSQYFEVLAMRRRKAKNHIVHVEVAIKSAQQSLTNAFEKVSAQVPDAHPHATEDLGRIMRDCGDIAAEILDQLSTFALSRPTSPQDKITHYVQSMAAAECKIFAFVRDPNYVCINHTPLHTVVSDIAKAYLAAQGRAPKQVAEMEKLCQAIADPSRLRQKRDQITKMASLFAEEIAEKFNEAFPPRRFL